MWVKKVASVLFNETHECLVRPSQFFKVMTVLIIEKLPEKDLIANLFINEIQMIFLTKVKSLVVLV